MEGYVTVLDEMESAATLPVLMHSGSTVSDGPSDPVGSRWQRCFTVWICVSAHRPECICACVCVCECVCATVFVRLDSNVCIRMVRWRLIHPPGRMPNVCNGHSCVYVCVSLSLQSALSNLVFCVVIGQPI